MMHPTDPPVPRTRAGRRRDRATRSRRLVLAFVSFTAGMSFLGLASRPTSSTVIGMLQRLLLFQCGVLLASLPFFWLLYICIGRPPRRAAVSAQRALVVDGDAISTYFAFCFGIMLLVVGSNPSTSRILSPMLPEFLFGLGVVLTLASIELFVFHLAAYCLLEEPSEETAPSASQRQLGADLDAGFRNNNVQLDESARLIA